MAIKKIVVIGGSAAGAKAAAKARRLDEFADITIIQKAPDLSMASCGYPYYIGGVFNDRNALLCTPAGVVRDPVFFQKAKKIRALVETEAVWINRPDKTVRCRNLKNGEEQTLTYDKLVIATGARANMPPIPGIGLKGITTLEREISGESPLGRQISNAIGMIERNGNTFAPAPPQSFVC